MLSSINISSIRTLSRMSTKRALVILATGAEEMELVISVDVLRRAGIIVTVAGLDTDKPVLCSREVQICCDGSFEDALANGPFDAVVLPGGLVGTKNMCMSTRLGEFLKEQEAGNRIIAAVCAAPLALKTHGVFIGKQVTSYPSVRADLEAGGQYQYREENVVFDGNLLTSRSAGTTFDFAFALVERLMGKKVRDTVANALLLV